MEVIAEYHLGDIASVVGLFLTIGGFIITFWQIRKSKSAAEQAREAAEGVREQLLKMNAFQGLTAAIRSFEDIRRLHRLKAWQVLPDRYTWLKQELILIKGRTPNLSETHKAQIQGAIQQVSIIEGKVEIALGGADEPEVHRINSVISKQIDQLQQVVVDVQNEIERPRQ